MRINHNLMADVTPAVERVPEVADAMKRAAGAEVVVETTPIKELHKIRTMIEMERLQQAFKNVNEARREPVVLSPELLADMENLARKYHGR